MRVDSEHVCCMDSGYAIRECKFTEVKVAAQGYDWSGPIMVIEQHDCGSGMGSHPDWMSAEVAEGIPRE